MPATMPRSRAKIPPPALRTATALLAFAAATACAGPDAGSDAGSDASDAPAARDADALHARLITIDTHDDIPLEFATPEVDPLNADRQVTIEKMEAGGLDVGFFIVYVGQGERTPEGYAQAESEAMQKFEAIHRMTDELYPERIELARSADDVERIVGQGKLAAAIGVENGYPIGTDLSRLERFHALGARYMTLSHNGDNDIADSAQPDEELGDDPNDDGLTEFGEQVVAEMNRLGMMVDVSHISRASMMEAVRLSRAPVIASHSSTRALADHPRNMDDEQLRAMRDHDGVVQIVALGDFVKVQPPEHDSAVAAVREEMGIRGFADFRDMSAERLAEYRTRMAALDERWPPATVADFVDHIDHAVEVAGIDHVGISSDFDGGGGVVGWNEASETANVTRELVRRGYADEDIAKLWGGNLLRVWREVERVAATPPTAG
jgi:membrane dipeptidase